MDPVETLRLPEHALQALRACIDRVGTLLLISEFAPLCMKRRISVPLCSARYAPTHRRACDGGSSPVASTHSRHSDVTTFFSLPTLHPVCKCGTPSAHVCTMYILTSRIPLLQRTCSATCSPAARQLCLSLSQRGGTRPYCTIPSMYIHYTSLYCTIQIVPVAARHGAQPACHLVSGTKHVPSPPSMCLAVRLSNPREFGALPTAGLLLRLLMWYATMQGRFQAAVSTLQPSSSVEDTTPSQFQMLHAPS